MRPLVELGTQLSRDNAPVSAPTVILGQKPAAWGVQNTGLLRQHLELGGGAQRAGPRGSERVGDRNCEGCLLLTVIIKVLFYKRRRQMADGLGASAPWGEVALSGDKDAVMAAPSVQGHGEGGGGPGA